MSQRLWEALAARLTGAVQSPACSSLAGVAASLWPLPLPAFSLLHAPRPPQVLSSEGIFLNTNLWGLVPGSVPRPAFPAGVVSREAVCPDSSLCSPLPAFSGLLLGFLPFLHTDTCQEVPFLGFCTSKSSQFCLSLCVHRAIDRKPWVKPGMV